MADLLGGSHACPSIGTAWSVMCRLNILMWITAKYNIEDHAVSIINHPRKGRERKGQERKVNERKGRAGKIRPQFPDKISLPQWRNGVRKRPTAQSAPNTHPVR